jgi:hypothetical protein
VRSTAKRGWSPISTHSDFKRGTILRVSLTGTAIAQVFEFQCVGLAVSLSNSETETLRCLWLARELPLPLTSGDKIYTARLAQALAAGVSVTFMGLASSATSSLQAAEAFEGRIEWIIVPGRPNPTVLALASPLPLVAARYCTRNYVQHFEAILRTRGFDAVILDHYAMVWAVDVMRKSDKERRASAHRLHRP